MPINTSRHPKTLWPGIQKLANISYNEHAKEYTFLFDETASDKRYEEIVQEIDFGLPAEQSEGSSVTYDVTAEGYTTRITNVSYGLGYIVTREELDDNQYMQLSSRRAPALTMSFNQGKETIGGNIYNRAFDSNYTYGDGKELCATDHPLGNGGTFSNELDPAADLSHDALEDLTIQIMGAVNERNLKIRLMPKSLIVPRQLWYEANRIIKSTLQSGTPNNDMNTLKNVFPGGIVLNHYLTDADAYFIRTDVPVGEGLIFQKRIPFEFTQDNDFDTSNAKAKGYERYAFSVHDPRALYASAGA